MVRGPAAGRRSGGFWTPGVGETVTEGLLFVLIRTEHKTLCHSAAISQAVPSLADLKPQFLISHGARQPTISSRLSLDVATGLGLGPKSSA